VAATISDDMVELRTSRLLLRHWREADADPWAAMNADPAVMEHFPAPLTRAEADAARERFAADLDDRGWGLWVVEERASDAFTGFVGLAPADFDAPFAPAVEIGWRLAQPYWGMGYASEAARAVMAHAFLELGLAEIVSFTATVNTPSEAVMRRIGLTPHPAGPFDHPRLEPGHRLERHVLYRITAAEWAGAAT
jgi:RimJ/RimL family protein N-acetyltransferase